MLIKRTLLYIESITSVCPHIIATLGLMSNKKYELHCHHQSNAALNITMTCILWRLNFFGFYHEVFPALTERANPLHGHLIGTVSGDSIEGGKTRPDSVTLR